MPPMTLNLQAIQDDWQRRGFSFGLWEDPPGQVWEDYVHDSEEIFMVLEGRVELEMDGRKLKPQPGKEILIPKGRVHSVRNLGRTHSRWLYGYRS